jgi:glycosyltransferase involved in cell wall biosynthesis
MSVTSPLVSVVIPLYNGERFIGPALESIFAQDHRPLEVIVVDDGSADRGLEIAAGFDGVRCIRQEHQNVAAARNRGVSESSGELVGFLDQDDMWLPHAVSIRLDFLARNLEVGAVIGHQENVCEDGARAGLRVDQAPGRSVQLMLGATLVRRSVFDSVGLFDVRSGTSSDFQWFARARRAGVRIEVMSDVVLIRRLHAANDSNDLARHQRSLLNSLKLLLDESRGAAARTP